MLRKMPNRPDWFFFLSSHDGFSLKGPNQDTGSSEQQEQSVTLTQIQFLCFQKSSSVKCTKPTTHRVQLYSKTKHVYMRNQRMEENIL